MARKDQCLWERGDRQEPPFLAILCLQRLLGFILHLIFFVCFFLVELSILCFSSLLFYWLFVRRSQSPKYPIDTVTGFHSLLRNWALPPVFPGVMSCAHPLLPFVSLFLFWMTCSKNCTALAMVRANPPLLMIIEVLWGRAPNLR